MSKVNLIVNIIIIIDDINGINSNININIIDINNTNWQKCNDANINSNIKTI